MLDKIVVSSSKNASPLLVQRAQKWAEKLNLPYLERYTAGNLEEILGEDAIDGVLAATKEGPVIYYPGGKFFYHPGFATIRWKRVAGGENDVFLRATELKKGEKFLDCTLGLAADSIIAAAAVGETGSVTGLEASDMLYFLTSEGLKNYQSKIPEMSEAMRRIEVVHDVAENFLKKQPDDAFDVIYFDPMFQRPVKGSSAMEILRPLAYVGGLEKSTVDEALRVAPRVVIKERSPAILASLGCSEIAGGKYSKIKYGIRRR